MPSDHYIEIPVTNQFNPDHVIGQLRIDKTQLPNKPNYLFAIGGVVKDGQMQPSERLGREVYTITDFELQEIALIPADQYDWKKAQDLWMMETAGESEPVKPRKPRITAR